MGTCKHESLNPRNEQYVFPYDMYCLCVKTKVKSRLYKDCHIYLLSQAAVKRHSKGGCPWHHEIDIGQVNQELTYEGGEEDEELGETDEQQDDCHIFNIFSILQNGAFTEED